MKNHTGRMFLAIYLPEWSVELAAREYRRNGHAREESQKESSFVLIGRERRQEEKEYVRRYSQKLHCYGVCEGIPLELAQSLAPPFHIASFQPEQDLQSLIKLAHWAMRFSPLVGIERELLRAAQKKELSQLDAKYMGIILDITGTERLHSAQKSSPLSSQYPREALTSLTEKISASLRSYGFTATFGAAPTVAAAWALARYNLSKENPSSPSLQWISSVQEGKEVLSSLPLSALRISHSLVLDLNELGLYTISSLLKIPRKKIATRFGISLIRSLDELFGEIPEPLSLVQSREELFFEREFDPPLITKLQVREGVHLVFEELISRATERHRKPCYFKILLSGTDRSFQSFVREKQISLHAESSDQSHLSSLLAPIIESISFPGTVSEIRIETCGDGFSAPQQLTAERKRLLHSEAPENLLNVLSLHLRKGALSVLEFRESHLPEKSFLYRPLQPKEIPTPLQKSVLPSLSYPSLIFSPPHPIRALSLLPDQSPVRIYWEQREYRVLKSLSPERICEEWWRAPLTKESFPEEREYFRLQDDTGRWLWIFRRKRDLSWYIHGIWA